MTSSTAVPHASPPADRRAKAPDVQAKSAIRVSLLTNMVAPYRVPFLAALSRAPEVARLRVLTCTERESDRQWTVHSSSSYDLKRLWGITVTLRRGHDMLRIVHLRFGIAYELLVHRPDTLIIGDASWTTYLAVAFCRMLRIPYVVWNEITTSSRVSSGIVARLRRYMYRHATKCIASGALARLFLVSQGCSLEKICIARNAIDDAAAASLRKRWEPHRADLRHSLGLSDEAFVFLFVGQLITRKRPIETLDLVANVRANRPVHLIIAGSGPLESALRERAAAMGYSAVSFCGYVEGDALAQLYVSCDALVLLSEDEPWGMVINEALAFGKPFLASDSVGAAVELASEHPESQVVAYGEQATLAVHDMIVRDPRFAFHVSPPPSIDEMTSSFTACLRVSA